MWLSWTWIDRKLSLTLAWSTLFSSIFHEILDVLAMNLLGIKVFYTPFKPLCNSINDCYFISFLSMRYTIFLDFRTSKKSFISIMPRGWNKHINLEWGSDLHLHWIKPYFLLAHIAQKQFNLAVFVNMLDYCARIYIDG